MKGYLLYVPNTRLRAALGKVAGKAGTKTRFTRQGAGRLGQQASLTDVSCHVHGAEVSEWLAHARTCKTRWSFHFYLDGEKPKTPIEARGFSPNTCAGDL